MSKDRKIKFSLLGVVVLLVILTVMGMWAIDLSYSMVTIEESYGIDLFCTNGWLVRDPVRHYHLGLYLTYGSLVGFALLSIFSILHINPYHFRICLLAV